MSDRQSTPEMMVPEQHPDRPIATATEDRLGRSEFVARLARALVTPTGRASGVVIGLNGPWGSGKSSILNLLAEECGAAAKRENRPAPVVVRFDPWLVSGRDDLVSRFIKELNAEIRKVGTAHPEIKATLLELANRLAVYGKDLSAGVGWLLFGNVPLGGTFMSGLFQFIAALTGRVTTLDAQRETVRKCLAGVPVPIIVLIDELDRVEDAEVRTVAQLVRAVADFPGISYLLAYDRVRVVEALGDKNVDRGAAYLEKIVQLEVRVPSSLSEEIGKLLDEALQRLADLGVLPAQWSADTRFVTLRHVLVPSVLPTPRDLRRATGMFAVLVGMLRREIDWVDLLGYSVLLAKMPRVVDAIQRRPEAFTIDFLTPNWYRFAGGNERTSEERLKDFNLTSDAPEAKLLAFLFPCFAEKEAADEPPPSRMLRTLEGLNTVLRLGLVPGVIAHEDFGTFVGLDAERKQRDVQRRIDDGTIGQFLHGLLHAYPDFDDPDPVGTILLFFGLAPISPEHRVPLHQLEDQAHTFHRFVHRSIQLKPSLAPAVVTAVERMLSDGKFELVARFLEMESEDHGFDTFHAKVGMFGRAFGSWPRTRREDIERLRDKFRTAIQSAQTGGTLLQSLRTLIPIIFGIRMGAWNEGCCASLSQSVAADQIAFLSFVQLWTDVPEPSLEGLDGMLDTSVLCRRLAEFRYAEDTLFNDPVVKTAMEKAHRAVEQHQRSSATAGS
ncbi:hypothetical protein J2848_005242 [Azospirillum lipoferum]|nr:MULTISPECIES: P-loop NTPase fold protein [Azospirillum]MCP1613546.1 hypothetical protein [Azospirillum lipoferum]MDW5532310.1 P-loop NTPase fold protein [Azospirillum sp. NL1]